MKIPSLLLSAAALCACASSKPVVDPTKPLAAAAVSDASKTYDRGLREKKDQNYVEASIYFEAVRSNFPYSQYAALSDLALADMSFEKEDYAAAATAYQDFVKSHPSHPKADYAAFRIGLANFQDKPSDWFLIPPSWEKDQAPVRQALEALQRFTTGYPKSEYLPRARDLINDCRERLAAHDRYVAGFYWKKQAWRGAAGRLLGLADSYGDLEEGRLRSDSLWRAAVAYQLANDTEAQRTVLQRLVQETPAADPHHQYAEAELKALPAPQK